MRTIVCPECGGDGYTERFIGGEDFGKQPCEKCGGEGKLEDTVSPEMYTIVDVIESWVDELNDTYDETFDEDGTVIGQMLDLSSALYELQSLLKARCK